MAKIQKILEDNLIGNGSNEQILPVTIDKAVGTKAINTTKNKIVPLNETLSRLWYRSWCYGVWSDNTMSEKVYYLFSFNTLSDYNNFIQYIQATKKQFINLVKNNSTDEEDLDSIDTYTEDIHFNNEDLLNRLSYKVVNNLYLQYIELHSSLTPRVTLEDERGNTYTNGDTIYFTSYPGKVKVLLRGITEESLVTIIKSFILNTEASQYRGYGFQIEGMKSNSDEVDMQFTEDLTRINPHRPYHTAEINDAISISTINDIVNRLINEGFWVYVYPADYPNNSTELSDYCTQLRKGNMIVRESFLNIDLSVDTYLDNIPFTEVKLVFNPDSEFVFTNNDNNNIVLNSTNNYISTTVVKGDFASDGATITIGFGDATDYEISIDGINYVDGYNTNIEVTSEDIEAGILVYVRPKNWSNTDNYTPYSEVTISNVTVHCIYNDDVINKDYQINVLCQVTEKGLAMNTMKVISSIEDITDNDTRVGYLTLALSGSIKSLELVDINGYYFDVFINPSTQEVAWNTTKYDINNVLVGYATGEINESTNFTLLNKGQKITTQELSLNNNIVFKLYVPVTDTDNRFIKGRGGVNLVLQDEDNKYYYTIPLTLLPESLAATDMTDYNEWREETGIYISPSAKRKTRH